MKIESLFDQMEIPHPENKEKNNNFLEDENCSSAVLKVCFLLISKEKFEENLTTRICSILKNFPKENFLAN